MKKLKQFLFNNGSLTLLSIISIILVFAIVCFSVLSVIYKTGIIEIPYLSQTADSTQNTLSPSYEADNREPDYEAIDHESNIKTLLASFPYYDDFYAEFYITYIYESYNVEFCRIYKQNEKYRIEIYDMQNDLSSLVVCDGYAVSVQNEDGVSERYLISEEFDFEAQAPLPSFLFYKTGEYVLKSYTEEKGVCTVECEYPLLGTKDIITIDTETGLMKNYLMYLGDKVIMFYDIMEFDIDVAFDEETFTLT